MKLFSGFWRHKIKAPNTKISKKDKVAFLFFVAIILAFVLRVAKETFISPPMLWAPPITSHKASMPELWSLSEIYADDNWHQPSITAQENKVFVLGSNNIYRRSSVMAFDGNSGQLVWQSSFGGSTITSTESKVILGGPAKVMALDAQNGKLLWSAVVRVHALNIVPKDNRLYVSGDSVRHDVLDISNGKLLEKFEKPYSIDEEPSLGDLAYIRDGNDYVIAQNKTTGQELWRNKANAISNLAVTSSFIYALGQDGSLLQLNSQTGQKESWTLFSSTSFEHSSQYAIRIPYYVAVDTSTNIAFVYLGDSAQLFAFKLPIS